MNDVRLNKLMGRPRQFESVRDRAFKSSPKTEAQIARRMPEYNHNFSELARSAIDFFDFYRQPINQDDIKVRLWDLEEADALKDREIIDLKARVEALERERKGDKPGFIMVDTEIFNRPHQEQEEFFENCRKQHGRNLK